MGAEPAEADRLLRHMHENAFRTWMNYGLEEQRAALDAYLSGLDCGKAAAVRAWLRLESYRSFIPESAASIERKLFLGNLELLLQRLVREIGGLGTDDKQFDSAQPLLTTNELSKLLDLSPRTIRLWAECEQLPAFKVGRQWRFRCDHIRRWLEQQKADELSLMCQS